MFIFLRSFFLFFLTFLPFFLNLSFNKTEDFRLKFSKFLNSLISVFLIVFTFLCVRLFILKDQIIAGQIKSISFAILFYFLFINLTKKTSEDDLIKTKINENSFFEIFFSFIKKELLIQSFCVFLILFDFNFFKENKLEIFIGGLTGLIFSILPVLLNLKISASNQKKIKTIIQILVLIISNIFFNKLR